MKKMEENQLKMTTKKIAQATIVGAAYAALTAVLAPISYGPIQFRISEVLCILPFFAPFTSWGLFLGCIIANLASPSGVLDVIFGPLATLGACLCIAAIGKRGVGAKSWLRILLACLMPALWNGVIIGLVLMWTLTETHFPQFSNAFWVFGGEVALGELAVMLILGIPVIKALQHTPWAKQESV
mgnify:CR=1 FL=1